MDTILTKPTPPDNNARQRRFVVALIAGGIFSSPLAYADDYRDARADLVSAYQQQDYPEMLLAANRALAVRPGFPQGLFNLAMTQTLNSDHAASLETLELLLHKGVEFGADERDEFSAVRELEGWGTYATKLKALRTPIGTARVHATYGEAKFVPEGIAMDPDGSLYLGSIHTGQLIRLGDRSRILSHGDEHWSVFGMRFHPDGSLWFASAAVPQLKGVGDAAGKTGLFRFDLATMSITKAAELPPYAAEQVLGDLVIADANTIYATDSLTGAIYRYYIDSNEFEILVERGELGSPQGLDLDDSGGYLYVADYIGGLFRVSLLDGSLIKVLVADNITDYGIDGLYRYKNELIVIQNGVRPHRVAALKLSEKGVAIVESRLLASNLPAFDEPTLGAIHAGNFYFVANSHWGRFDREIRLPDGLPGPIVLTLPLQ